MGFFKNLIKARDEWLAKPNTLPNTAVYLNTNSTTNPKTNSK